MSDMKIQVDKSTSNNSISSHMRRNSIWRDHHFGKLVAGALVANPKKLNIEEVENIEKLQEFLCDGTHMGLVCDEIKSIQSCLYLQYFNEGEAVFNQGTPSDAIYLVVEGSFSLFMESHKLTSFKSGMTFGEIGFIEDRPRRGCVIADEKSLIFVLSRQVLFSEEFPPKISMKILKYMSERLLSLLQGFDLYREMDVLIIQDGGCSPGYNPAVAFLTEYFEATGRRVFAANTGFKSVVSGLNSDYSFLIHDNDLYRYLSLVPNSVYAPSLRIARGADFRTERYPDFKNPEIQKIAVENIVKRKVKIVVCVGGNGTFMGAKSLSDQLPPNILTYFIPATIDSDVIGTECLGEHTAVDVGSEKLRCYMADARTHHRCYIIELMGREGGFHCLFSSLGAGAHLAVLPGAKLQLDEIARCITKCKYTVIAVAEGYARKERVEDGHAHMNAAQYLKWQLQQTGFLDEEQKKVVCEPFSRDIRGAAPNYLDVLLAQVLAREVVNWAIKGEGNIMPTKNGEHVGALKFDKITTENSVDPRLAHLADRLHINFTQPLAQTPRQSFNSRQVSSLSADKF